MRKSNKFFRIVLIVAIMMFSLVLAGCGEGGNKPKPVDPSMPDTPPAPVETAAEMYIESAEASGDAVTVKVALKAGSQNVTAYGYQFALSYDSEKLELNADQSVGNLDNFDFYCGNDSVNSGCVRVMSIPKNKNDQGVVIANGQSKTLAQLKFSSKDSGSVSFSIVNPDDYKAIVSVHNTNGNPVSYSGLTLGGAKEVSISHIQPE